MVASRRVLDGSPSASGAALTGPSAQRIEQQLGGTGDWKD
jgi:hypothetical protein